MSEKSLSTVTRDGMIFFIELGRNELGAKTMIGISKGVSIAGSNADIGKGILANLSVPRILTVDQNEDLDSFERACAAIGFTNSNDFFLGGALVHVQTHDRQLLFLPTKVAGHRTIQHAFLEPITSDVENVEKVGRDFLRAVKLCR